jgi:hypothetical protein
MSCEGSGYNLHLTTSIGQLGNLRMLSGNQQSEDIAEYIWIASIVRDGPGVDLSFLFGIVFLICKHESDNNDGIYTINEGSRTVTQILAGSYQSFFGFSLAMSADSLFVGAPNYVGGGQNKTCCFCFELQ